jgi:hypothetical protein
MFYLLLPVGIAFWVILSAFFLFIVWCADDEINSYDDYSAETAKMFGWSVLLIVLCVAFTNVSFRGILEHPLVDLIAIISYFVGGIVWSFLKWYLFNLKKADEYARNAAKYQTDYNALKAKETVTVTTTTDTSATLPPYKEWVQGKYRFPPEILNFKMRLLTWTLYWPVYVVKFMFSDFIEHLWNMIYSWFSGLYQKVTDHVFGKFTELK